MPFTNPTTAQVAAYVPSRTVDYVTTPGSETQLNDFGSNTVPVAAVVTDLINDAVAWVFGRVGTLDASLYTDAVGIAAKRAAAWVEIGYPVTTDDVNTGQLLLEQANAELEQLAATNMALGVGVIGGAEPQWAMPAPVTWGDKYL